MLSSIVDKRLCRFYDLHSNWISRCGLVVVYAMVHLWSHCCWPWLTAVSQHPALKPILLATLNNRNPKCWNCHRLKASCHCTSKPSSSAFITVYKFRPISMVGSKRSTGPSLLITLSVSEFLSKLYFECFIIPSFEKLRPNSAWWDPRQCRHVMARHPEAGLSQVKNFPRHCKLVWAKYPWPNTVNLVATWLSSVAVSRYCL